VSVVVSDTSPLHYLILCGLDAVLARLFERVVISLTVFSEFQHANTPALVEEWMRSLPTSESSVGLPHLLESLWQVNPSAHSRLLEQSQPGPKP
jgi:predicted nucleic acid-binding protein